MQPIRTLNDLGLKHRFVDDLDHGRLRGGRRGGSRAIIDHPHLAEDFARAEVGEHMRAMIGVDADFDISRNDVVGFVGLVSLAEDHGVGWKVLCGHGAAIVEMGHPRSSHQNDSTQSSDESRVMATARMTAADP